MADPSTAPPLQPAQPSRKGKKAWRKHVDITQLEHGLAKARDDQIAGGPVSELPSTELFSTDPTGSPALREIAQKVQAQRQRTADRLLAQRSGVPSLSRAKRRAAPSSLPEPATVAAPERKRARTNGVSYREYHRLRAVAYGGEGERAAALETRTGDASFDPWADDGPQQQLEEEDDDEMAGLDFVPPPRAWRAPDTLRREPVNLTADGRPVRAVRRPAAEKSYNPTFDDWAARFEREGAKEVEAERRRLEVEAEAQARLDLAEKAQAEEEEREREKTKRAEAGEGEEDEGEGESEWEGIASEAEAKAPEWLLKKRPERKTQAQRNRIARRKEEERRAKAAVKDKAKAQQAIRIAALAKEVRARERARGEALAAVPPARDSSDDEGEVVLRRRQFGKARLPEPRLEILLPEDVPESLRRLKPEGNLLHDRYRSLVLRGKVESRRSTQQKKAKTKRTEKWSYKDWRLK